MPELGVKYFWFETQQTIPMESITIHLRHLASCTFTCHSGSVLVSVDLSVNNAQCTVRYDSIEGIEHLKYLILFSLLTMTHNIVRETSTSCVSLAGSLRIKSGPGCGQVGLITFYGVE